MRVNYKSILAAGFLAAAFGLSASAAPVTISALNQENGVFYNQTTGGNYGFTSGLGFDFTGQSNLTTLTDITVTLTIADGDSDIGEFDHGNLFLTLDGINTGLVLDGFTGSAQIVTLTLNVTNPGTAAAILLALADGKLTGGVLDTDADGPAGNTIGFPAALKAALDLTGNQGTGTIGGGGTAGVPLPAAVVLAPLGAGLAGMFARRFRKAK